MTTSTHMITTKAAPAVCPRCDALILTAIAEGLTARVDPTPITPTDELAELLAGAWTYTLTRSNELVHRDAGRIQGGHLRGPVLPEHRCPGQPAAHQPRLFEPPF